MKLADYLVTAVVLVLVGVGLGAAVVKRTAEADRRVRCASQLRQLGQGFLLYANENKGRYPRTIYDAKTADKPVWGTPYEKNLTLGPSPVADPFGENESKAYRPDANDVSAALFLIVRTQDLEVSAFVCPSTFRAPFDFGAGNNALGWSNWKGIAGLREHLSYSIQNPYGTTDVIEKGWRWNNNVSPDYAIAADMNPGADDLLKLSPNAGREKLRAGNSRNHGGDGQNVLYGDGHVEFLATPFVGADQDNIYTYGDTGKAKPDSGGAGIIGSSVSDKDSILLPTAVALAQEPVNPDPAIADEVAKAKPVPVDAKIEPQLWKTIGGEYSIQRSRNNRMTLVIEEGRATVNGLNGSASVVLKMDQVAAGDPNDLRVFITQGNVESAAAISVGATDILIIGGPAGIDGRWYRPGAEPMPKPDRNSSRK